METGRLEVVKVDGEEMVVLYNSQGHPVDSTNIVDYRGGVTYHAEEVNTFVLAVDMLTHFGLPLASFQAALDFTSRIPWKSYTTQPMRIWKA